MQCTTRYRFAGFSLYISFLVLGSSTYEERYHFVIDTVNRLNVVGYFTGCEVSDIYLLCSDDGSGCWCCSKSCNGLFRGRAQ